MMDRLRVRMWMHRLHVHVCAIAWADDAAVNITWACVYVFRYISFAEVIICIYFSYVDVKSRDVNVYACTFLCRGCVHVWSRA